MNSMRRPEERSLVQRLRAAATEAEADRRRLLRDSARTASSLPRIPVPGGGVDAAGPRGKAGRQTEELARLWERHARTLEASMSWRVTAPLRWAAARLIGRDAPRLPPPPTGPAGERAGYWQRRAMRVAASRYWKLTEPLRRLRRGIRA